MILSVFEDICVYFLLHAIYSIIKNILKFSCKTILQERLKLNINLYIFLSIFVDAYAYFLLQYIIV